MTSEPPRFVGSIPALYDKHMGPTLFEPYARETADRSRPYARSVIEIAAGTGRVTRQLLTRLPADAKLVATDLNEPMLVEAQKHINDPRVSFQVADAQSLPFPDGSADMVVCQFGLMFVPDKQLAVREMMRVLAPGGLLLVTVWDDVARNPASKIMQDLAFATLPEDPPLFMRVPFSMPDPHELERLATAVRFKGIRVDTVEHVGHAESAAFLAHGFVRGNPLWLQLTERGVDVDGLEAKVTETLGTRFGDKPCRPPMSAHVLTAFA